MKQLFSLFLTITCLSYASQAQAIYTSTSSGSFYKLEKGTTISSEGNFYDAIQESISNLKSKGKIAVDDSLIFQLEFDGEGAFIGLSCIKSILQSHKSQLTKVLEKYHFSSGINQMAIVLKSEPVEAYWIESLDAAPKLEECEAVDDKNKTFAKACYNYMVELAKTELLNHVKTKANNIDGSFAATFVVSAEGKIVQTKFDALSFNPELNQLIIDKSAGVSFPPGGFVAKKQVAYKIKMHKTLMNIDSNKLANYLNDFETQFNSKKYPESIFSFRKALQIGHKADRQERKRMGDAYYFVADTGEAMSWWKGLYEKEDFEDHKLVPEIVESEILLHLEPKNKSGGENDILSFAIVEHKPIFPGCEKFEDEDDRFQCFNTGVLTHISRNFHYPKEARQRGIQGKLYVSFVIEKDGSVSSVKMLRGVHPLLDLEAMRLISSLPKMTAATQRGKNVRMQYTVPINARLQ